MRGATVQTKDGEIREIHAKYVIVADGANSRFGRALGTFRTREWPYGTAIRTYWETPRHADPWIESALDVLKVERIDHGVQSTRDAALMRRLAADRIPLTVCPLSNQKLCVFPNLADHNLGRLLDAGLVATVNSDDPAYFGGYMNDNFLQTFAATGLGAPQAYTLMRNSFEASFLAPSAKRAMLDRVDAVFLSA